MHHPNRKKILGFICLLLLVTGGLFAVPRKSHAFACVSIFGTTALQCVLTNPLGAGLASMDAVKEYILMPAARIVIRTLLTATTNQIVSWIQGDSGKNVGYVANLDKAFRREADVAGGEFLNKISGINLCGNIGASLQIRLRAPTGLEQRLSCTVTDIVANVNNFYRSFQSGGWPAFVGLSLEPQNSAYGAYMIALEAKVSAETVARRRLELPLQKSYPFLGFRVPVKKCTTFEAENTEEAYEATGGAEIKAIDQSQLAVETGGRLSGQGFEACETEYETKTPGQLISDTLSKATGGGLDFAINAKDFDEAIATIITALINRLITATFSGGSGIENAPIPAGQGIFSPPISQITLPVEENNAIFLKQTDDAIFYADGLITAMERELKIQYERQFIARQQGSGTFTFSGTQDTESKIATLITNKQSALGTKTSLLDLRRNMTSPNVDAKTLQNLAQQTPQHQSRLSTIASAAGIAIDVPTATGNPRGDALQTIRGATDTIRATLDVVDVVVREIDRVASSTETGPSKASALVTQKRILLLDSRDLSQSLGTLELRRLDVERATTDNQIRSITTGLIPSLMTLNRLIQDTDSAIQLTDQVLKQ